MTKMPIGSIEIECSCDLAHRIGWTPYDGGGGRWSTGEAPEELFTALSDYLEAANRNGKALLDVRDSDRIVIRAIALRSARINRSESDCRRREAAKDDARAAGFRLAAEREITGRMSR